MCQFVEPSGRPLVIGCGSIWEGLGENIRTDRAHKMAPCVRRGDKPEPAPAVEAGVIPAEAGIQFFVLVRTFPLPKRQAENPKKRFIEFFCGNSSG